jgi:alpha-beta hydrolase superfamily lysophospholipase
MRLRLMMRRLLAALAIVATLGACAAQLQPMGQAVRAPALTDTAYETADGLSLPLRRWMPDGEPRAVVLALHGFNDYSFGFDKAARFLAANGVAVYAYDQRGFGASPRTSIWSSTETMVSDATTMLGLVIARHPQAKHFLLGHSMGGGLALIVATEKDFAARVPGGIDGLILEAPAAWSRDQLGLVPRSALWLARTFTPGAAFSGANLGIRPSDNIDMLRAYSRDPLVIKKARVDQIYGLVELMSEAAGRAAAMPAPALVLYGANEQVLRANSVAAFQGAVPNDPRIHSLVYAKGWHMLMRDLQGETVWRDVLAFIEDPARATLPSEATGASVRAARDAVSAQAAAR